MDWVITYCPFYQWVISVLLTSFMVERHWDNVTLLDTAWGIIKWGDEVVFSAITYLKVKSKVNESVLSNDSMTIKKKKLITPKYLNIYSMLWFNYFSW